MKKSLTKEEVIKLLEKVKLKGIDVYSDDKWLYPLDLPPQLRDEGNCIMLHAMFNIEKKKGILIYLPYVTLEELENEKKEIKEEKKESISMTSKELKKEESTKKIQGKPVKKKK